MSNLSIERMFCDLSMAIAERDRIEAIYLAAEMKPELLERFKREHSGSKRLEAWLEPVRQCLYSRLTRCILLAKEAEQ